jgi:hypothetical protein
MSVPAILEELVYEVDANVQQTTVWAPGLVVLAKLSEASSLSRKASSSEDSAGKIHRPENKNSEGMIFLNNR